MKQQQEYMSKKEALAQGYTHCMANYPGNTEAYKIDDIEEEDATFVLCHKEKEILTPDWEDLSDVVVGFITGGLYDFPQELLDELYSVTDFREETNLFQSVLNRYPMHKPTNIRLI